jgi:hypothetical protein
VLAKTDLLILLLRVLPREIHQWLQVNHTFPRKQQERLDAPRSANEEPVFGQFNGAAACGRKVQEEIRKEVRPERW